MLEEVADLNPLRDAVIHGDLGVRYNFKVLSREVDRIARGFIQQGINSGDKVAIWAHNTPEWLLSFLGLTKIGAITVPIDPNAAEENLRYILEQSESRGLIIPGDPDSPTFVEMALAAKKNIASLEFIFVCGESGGPDMVSWAELQTLAEDVTDSHLAEKVNKVQSTDPMAIMYTSGTTGQPKGVVLDHLGLINKSMVSTARQGITAEDRLCLFFPLFHMFGNTCIALAGLLRGACLIMPSKIFDPQKVLKAVSQEKCTAIYGSPSMMIALVDHPEFKKEDWSSVSKGIIGGAPCPIELMRRIHTRRIFNDPFDRDILRNPL